MREIKNERRGVREWARESKQAHQKNQSGERDNPSLFIYSSYFQGTSHEAFSLNIWWTLCPWFTVLTLYLQGPRVQGCVTTLQRTSFSHCLSIARSDRYSLMWKDEKMLKVEWCSHKNHRIMYKCKMVIHYFVCVREEEGEAALTGSHLRGLRCVPARSQGFILLWTSFLWHLLLKEVVRRGQALSQSWWFFCTAIDISGEWWKKCRQSPVIQRSWENSCGSVGACRSPVFNILTLVCH